MTGSDDARTAAVIGDPARRALFDLVRHSREPVSRDVAAAATGLPRSTAAAHLDRLVDEGLLEVEYRRLSGRSGPGAGRPSKLYRSTGRELELTVPPREYALAGNLLAAAIEESDRSGASAREALEHIARREGRELGERAGDLESALSTCGYEPEHDDEGGMRLRNCPFHRLAARHTELICHANLALLEGVAEGAGDTLHDVAFAPGETECCVRLPRRASASSPGRG